MISSFARRAFDLAIAVPGSILTAPVVLGLAAAVRLESPGSGFYRQTRVGKDRKPIQVVKLRTMRVGADRQGAHVTAKGDARITRLGVLLRKTKLDELPQLWNVVKGEMSLVGPRPEAPRYVDHYRPEWEEAFSVRPGLTDLASVVFRNEEDLLEGVSDRERAYIEGLMPVKMKLVLRGVEETSLSQDLVTILKTAGAVIGVTDDSDHPVLEEARNAIKELEER